jgi:hypothetical protein
MPQMAQKAYLTHSGLQHCLLFYLLFFYASTSTKSLPNALRLAALLTVQLVIYFMSQLAQNSYLTHSGLQPEIVSGLGINPAVQRQMAFPLPVTEHSAPGPHGEGSHGSGFGTHRWLWHT